MKKKIIHYLLAFFVFTAFLIFAGCTSEADTLEGVWERVLVENVNAGYTEEWHFFEGDITIRQISNDDPGDVIVIDRGIYKLKPVFNKTYLTLIINDASWPGYNADWEVLSLDKETLVIVHDVYGGITKREFIKK